MKRIPVLLAFLQLLSGLASGQTPSGYLGNYTQPAPNAASLGKYVDYPIGYYTGTPEISVPIFEIHDGAVKLPITLSYHSSGIRVSEMASWVGLGWNLNATGMIIRTVRGGPDEGVANPQISPSGYYLDSGIRKMPILPYPIGGILDYTGNSTQTWRYFLGQVDGSSADCEPDLFTFNFNGNGGKFVFDENRTPQLLTQQDLKISVNFDYQAGRVSGDFLSWKIVTPDGTQYYFGENSIYEVNKVYSQGLQDYNTNKPSSWYLTRIVYPNTKDTVLFSYTPETYSYSDLGQENVVFSGVDDVHGGTVFNACIAATAPPMNSLKTVVSGLRLTSIKTRNYTVSFIARNTKTDVDTIVGFPKPYTLDSVKIFNAQNQCIKQVALAYSYFTSTTATGASAGAMSVTNGSIADTKRLKLVSVKEISGDGTLTKPPYQFTYQEALQLPRRMSFDQDHWGFSNNNTGNANDRFTPTVYHSVCKSPGGTGIGANRNPKWPEMQAFTIKSITDPLGVVTSFEFESHTSTLMNPSDVVGGLRVHKIKTIDGVTGDSTIRLYDYGSGGNVYSLPNYLVVPHNEYYPDLRQTGFASYIGYDQTEFFALRSLIRQSQSVVPLQDFQGNHIGYSGVKEIFGPHGEGGYKIHSFMADPILNSSRLDINNYTQLATVQSTATDGVLSPRTGIFGNGHFNDISPQNLTYTSQYIAGNYWPLAPLQVDFRRGQLLNEDTYDSSGNLIQSFFNVYKQSYDETKWIRGFKHYQTSLYLYLYGPNEPPNIVYYDAFTYYKLHTGISHLIQNITKNYKDGKVFTSTTTYGYESAYHTQKTSDTTVNSQGDSLISKTYYSFDYANGATSDSVVKKMKARNMLVPVATRLWKNHQLVSGTITQFKDFAASSTDTLINPYKIYALDMLNPLTTTQAGENIALTGQLTTLIPTSTYFHEKATFNYNGTTGKINEQNLTSDKKQALIWDNQYSLPLAVVDNASVADVAYNSFESAETGNWSFTSSSITADASTPLGAKVYVLGSSNPITKSGLTSGKKYILSYWLKSGGSVTVTGGTQSNSITGSTVNTSWTYKQVAITTTGTSISLTGSGNIDEVRLYPATAQMVTYTYDGLLRLTDQCSANSTISQYEYDSLNRLIDIKDQFGNVIKAFEYNYGSLSR